MFHNLKYFSVVFFINSCIFNCDCCDQLFAQKDCKQDSRLLDNSLTSHNTPKQNVTPDLKQPKKKYKRVLDFQLDEKPDISIIMFDFKEKYKKTINSIINMKVRDNFKENFTKNFEYYNGKVNTFINDNVAENIDLLSQSDEWVFNRLVRYIKD